ncbi:MAG: DUF89 family protein [Lachnospiraceae bacterium]|nr:DUF89 family protein [Lachnospiraceae bacterium]
MKANSMCISCILSRQEKKIRSFEDEQKKSEYMNQVLKILYENGQTESAPWMAEKINRLYEKYWGPLEDYTDIKHEYNMLLLDKEADMEQKIKMADDPLVECIKYVCAGNYIDFTGVENVNMNTFEELLKKAEEESVCEEEYQKFRDDLASAKTLAYLTDNCGEIVLDKIFIRHIKEAYPDLNITVIVRGENVINDATMTDAEEVGLTEMVTCIGNGNAAPSTILNRLSDEAKRVLDDADVIISKGQGNFEGFCGEGYNPYFFFLCKCPLFLHRFKLPQFTSVFAKEERLMK